MRMDSPERTVGSFVQFFERLITDFSWRRLGFVAGFLALIGISLIIFELYTQSFKLARLDREAALLERMVALDEMSAAVDDAEITAALSGLKGRIRALTAPRATGTALSPQASQALYTALPWSLMALLMLASGGQGARSGIAGMLMVAIPLVVLNMNLPIFDRRWINYWLVPWGEFVLVMALILRWQRKRVGNS